MIGSSDWLNPIELIVFPQVNLLSLKHIILHLYPSRCCLWHAKLRQEALFVNRMPPNNHTPSQKITLTLCLPVAKHNHHTHFPSHGPFLCLRVDIINLNSTGSGPESLN